MLRFYDIIHLNLTYCSGIWSQGLVLQDLLKSLMASLHCVLADCKYHSSFLVLLLTLGIDCAIVSAQIVEMV